MRFNGLTAEEFYGAETLEKLEEAFNNAMMDLTKQIDVKGFAKVYSTFYKFLFTDCEESDVMKKLKEEVRREALEEEEI